MYTNVHSTNYTHTSRPPMAIPLSSIPLSNEYPQFAPRTLLLPCIAWLPTEFRPLFRAVSVRKREIEEKLTPLSRARSDRQPIYWQNSLPVDQLQPRRISADCRRSAFPRSSPSTTCTGRSFHRNCSPPHRRPPRQSPQLP